jgi:hypothetical protein
MLYGWSLQVLIGFEFHKFIALTVDIDQRSVEERLVGQAYHTRITGKQNHILILWLSML